MKKFQLIRGTHDDVFIHGGGGEGVKKVPKRGDGGADEGRRERDSPASRGTGRRLRYPTSSG